ncbi:MAG TPA: hypothetical protein VE575_11715 [Acidimicrobiales bacterium]|jgi:hypothetical protein|nr:hypothetical protein [Acidimicrobiales bacterium]
MAATVPVVRRPEPTVDYRATSTQRTVGPLIAVVGMMVVGVAFIAGLVAAQRVGTDTFARINAWAFGTTTLGLAIAKTGIAVVLIGIVVRLWMRVDSVKWSLGRLKPKSPAATSVERGDITTPFGKARATETAPKRRVIDRAARVLWFPMLAMGAMAVAGGFVLSLFWAGDAADRPGTAVDFAAWTQGLQFLGEAFLLGGISFLLGAILASLREGGGEVQESLGVTVKTLKMPLSAKLFIGLMAMGMMVAMAQFVLYIVATTVSGESSIQAWFAWLGPTREIGLGLLLSGIVLALYTIGTVLGFQFDRIKSIVRTGL